MTPSERENENGKAIEALSRELLENRLISERIDGKLDRLRDSQRLTDTRVEALLELITGSSTGGKSGLVVRVHDLEQKQIYTSKRLDEISRLVNQMNSMEMKLDKVITMQEEHPSLLYKIRFDTKKTIAWIVFVFMLLSIWYVSGIRQPILEFFGLPVF